ncbi:MAG: DNA-directed polymerase sigma-70 factor, partial [Marmoricola sp.]|nr:DNA-directed polymerase sigma-70 factor [Marmoricola sp.]
MTTLDTSQQTPEGAAAARTQPPAAADFPQVADQYRRELTAHCYRMTGSV